MSLLRAKIGAGRSKELIISMLDEQVKNDYIRRYDLPKDATWEDIRDEDVDAFIDDCEDNGLSLDEGDVLTQHLCNICAGVIYFSPKCIRLLL